METSLGKLQREVDRLRKENLQLKEKVEDYRNEKNNIKKSFNKYKDNVEKQIENKINDAIKKFESKQIEKLEKENNDLKERIFKLEKMLNISSDTSNLPPSKDPLWKKDTKVYSDRDVKTTEKNKGGQQGHPKSILQKFNKEEITEIKEYRQDTCSNCGSDNLELIKTDERDELDFDLVIKKIRNIYYTYKCRDCNTIISTTIPAKLHAENQYGENVQTLATALNIFGDVSYKRTRDIIKGLTNEQINPSEGYLAKLPKRASNNLQKFVFSVEEKIVNSSVVQHDDGVIKIGKTDDDKEKELKKIIEKSKEELTDEDIKKLNNEIKKNFNGVLRAYTNGTLKLYKAHTTKDSDTFKDDNILNRLSEETTVVHDHMKFNYNDLFKFKNAECNIHPIRKSRGVKANTNHEWPDKISNLLEEYNEKRKVLIKKKIDRFESDDLKDLNDNYDEIIKDGQKECNEFVHKYLYTEEKNLLDFFENYKTEILRWANDFCIPFTNNLCETMIRLVKAKMKISYLFKSIETARYYADMITYTETCQSFGVNRYEALKRLFSGNPYSLDELEKLVED